MRPAHGRIEANRKVGIPLAFEVASAAVTTTSLRVEVTLPPQWSWGIEEWRVK